MFRILWSFIFNQFYVLYDIDQQLNIIRKVFDAKNRLLQIREYMMHCREGIDRHVTHEHN